MPAELCAAHHAQQAWQLCFILWHTCLQYSLANKVLLNCQEQPAKCRQGQLLSSRCMMHAVPTWTVPQHQPRLDSQLATHACHPCRQYAKSLAAAHIAALTAAATKLGSQFAAQQDHAFLTHALLDAAEAFPAVLKLGLLPLVQQTTAALPKVGAANVS